MGRADRTWPRVLLCTLFGHTERCWLCAKDERCFDYGQCCRCREPMLPVARAVTEGDR